MLNSLLSGYQCYVSNTRWSNGWRSILSTVALFVFCFSIPVSLLNGSLPLQTIVSTCWYFHLFFKACTKGYVVNSYLANPDNEAVSHSATSSTNSWASWGAVTLELKQSANSTAVMYTRKSLISSVTQSILRPQQMFIKLNKCAWRCLDTACDRQPTCCASAVIQLLTKSIGYSSL